MTYTIYLYLVHINRLIQNKEKKFNSNNFLLHLYSFVKSDTYFSASIYHLNSFAIIH